MLDRRDAIKALAAIPLGFAFDFSTPLAPAANAFSAPDYLPKFFTANEWKTVSMLADYVIPKDEISGSATDAKVPEYMDWLLADQEASETSKVAMRGGLAWLDLECDERFGTTFLKSTDIQRRQVLDDIAWPAKARPALSQGVAFFTRFRDLTAAGFFSSQMGWKDVRFVGNVMNLSWNGCPPEALAKLGVTGDEMKTRIPVE